MLLFLGFNPFNLFFVVWVGLEFDCFEDVLLEFLRRRTENDALGEHFGDVGIQERLVHEVIKFKGRIK